LEHAAAVDVDELEQRAGVLVGQNAFFAEVQHHRVGGAEDDAGGLRRRVAHATWG
jgi:hypothetical protein